MPEPRKVNLRLGLLLRQAQQRATGALNAALAELSLTGRHFGVMMLLHQDGVSTQRDLIRRLGSDKAGMVRTVEELENLGLLSRTQSTSDRRVGHIRLTAKGERVFDVARSRAIGVAHDLFGQFSGAELETFEHVLTRLVADEGR